jgi:hypothetical protein
MQLSWSWQLYRNQLNSSITCSAKLSIAIHRDWKLLRVWWVGSLTSGRNLDCSSKDDRIIDDAVNLESEINVKLVAFVRKPIQCRFRHSKFRTSSIVKIDSALLFLFRVFRF